MGIGTSVALKIGIPIAIISAVGLGLFAFRTQIVGAVRGGAQTLGQIVTEPIGGFFQGIQTGLESIPTTIDFTFPTFTFGAGAPPPTNGGGSFLDDIGKFFDNLFNPGTDIPLPPTPPPPFEEQQTSELTALGGSLAFQTGSSQPQMSATRASIIAAFPDVVGLFDIIDTPQTEFIPLTQAGIQFVGADELIFSGQLFEEIGSLEEAVNFVGGA